MSLEVAEPMSPNRTIDVLADPSKMVTLLALNTFEEGQRVGFLELANRINDLQEPYGTREARRANLKNHCQKALLPAGLIEFEQPDLVPDGKTAHAVSLTEKGATAGVAISGAMLGLQLDVPHKDFLQKVMNIRVDPVRDNPRPLIYQKILDDGPAGVMEIARFAGISSARTTQFVQVLCENNVLTHQSLIGPTNRKYLLAAGDFPVTAKVTPPTQAVLDAALGLRSREHKVVTAQQLLDEVSRQKPRLPQQVAWESLRTWLEYKPHRSGLIRPVEYGKAKSKVAIAEAFRPYIQKMLDIRSLLMGNSPEARAFQAESRQNAEEIIHTPELVAQALAHRSGFAASGDKASDWIKAAEGLYMDSLVSGRSEIPLEELHRLAMEKIGKPITLKHFCARLIDSPLLFLRAHENQNPGSRLRKYVSGPLTETSDWVYRGACNNEDPELFFPLNTTDAFVGQANEAKAICQTCPVKLPCLKTAIDSKTTSGIRGGVWLDRPGELTPELKKAAEMVIIQPRRSSY